MKIIFASIIYTFFLICSSALAFETKWYICDSCTTAQKNTKAKSNAPNDPLSYAYVVDVNNGTITKWTVTVEPGFISAISITVDSTSSTKFNDYLDVLDAADDNYDLSPTEASCGFESSLQLVGDADELSDLYEGVNLTV